MVSLEITLGSGATPCSTTSRPAREIFIEPQQGASNIMAIGGPTVTTATGFSVQAKTANVPSFLHLGPYECGPVDVKDFYIIGTAAQKCNVHYVPY